MEITHPGCSRRSLLAGTAGAGLLAATAGSLSLPQSAQALTNDPYFPSYGDLRYSVNHYDVGNTALLSSNPSNHVLFGATTMHCVAHANLTYIDVDFALHVTGASVNGSKAKVTRLNWRKFRISNFHVSSGSSFTVTAGYSDNPVRRIVSSDGVVSRAYQMSFAGQPNGATYWHPSNDRLTNRASYSVSLSTQCGYDAIGPGRKTAGPIYFTGSGGRQMVNYRYELPEPVVSYMPAIHYGKFVESTTTWRGANGQSIPLLYAAAGGAVNQHVRFHTEQALSYLTNLYGSYPFSHSGAMIMDGFWYFWGEENTGLPTYLRAKSTDKYSATLIAHENAHMWFGNSVTSDSWKDVLLFHEGLATMIEFDYGRKYGVSSPYVARPSSLVSNPKSAGLFKVSVYNSSVGVIQELRRTIDGSIYQEHAPRFTKMLREIGEKYRWQNISRAQFKAEAERAAGKSLASFWSRYSL